MDFTITVDHEAKLIRYRHIGALNKSDIGKAWNEMLSMREFLMEKYDLLSDYRGASFVFDAEDVDFICRFFYLIREVLDNKKQAIIVDDPQGTALSLLFENEVNRQIGFIIKVFSTKRAAEEWLAH